MVKDGSLEHERVSETRKVVRNGPWNAKKKSDAQQQAKQQVNYKINRYNYVGG